MLRRFHLLDLQKSAYLLQSSTQPRYKKVNSYTIGYFLLSFLVILITSLLFSYNVINRGTFVVAIIFSLYIALLTLLATRIKWFDKFFITLFHLSLFITSFFLFIRLVHSNYSNYYLLNFLGLVIVFQFLTQRFKASLIYSCFIISLLLYSYLFLNNHQPTSKLFIFFIFLLVIGVVNLFFLIKDMQYLYMRDQIEYLKHVNHSSIYGFALTRWINSEFTVIEYGNQMEQLFKNTFKGLDQFQYFLNSRLDINDSNALQNLDRDQRYTKIITVEGSRYEIVFTKLVLRFNEFITLHCTDISERMREKEDLISREQKYRNLYNKNQAGVFTLNMDGVLIDFNNTFNRMFENTIQLNEKFFKKEFFEDWEELMDIVMSRNNLKNYQTQIHIQKENTKWFIFNFYYDVQTDFIDGTVVDITEVQKASIALRQSEEKYRLVYEESNDVIFLLNGDRIIDVNKRGEQLFGIPEEELLNHTLWDLSNHLTPGSLEEIKKIKEKISISRITKFNWQFKGKFQPIDGEVAIAELVVGNNVYHQCVIHDITERLSTFKELEARKENFQNMLENIPEVIFIIHSNKIVYSNDEFVKLFKNKNIGLNELFTSKDQKLFEEALDFHRIKENGFQNKLRLFSSVNNEETEVDVTIVHTEYEYKDSFLVMMKDITLQNKLEKEQLRLQIVQEANIRLEKEISDRVRTENKLENLLLKTKSIYDSSSNNLVLTLDINLNLTYFNSHVKDYFSDYFKKHEMIYEGMSFDRFIRNIFRAESISFLYEKIQEVIKGESFQFDLSIGYFNQQWLNIFVNPIYDTNGKIAEISILAHDITNKKQYERELQNSLKEKEILLKEIHHRVKNNLQVISSILNLQSNYINDERTLGVLQESRNRIRSMSLIHENLYRTTNFASIDFAAYIKNLVTNLRTLYYDKDTHVVFNYELEEVNLALDQAVPSGLILNELITNALKYAVFKGELNVITISVQVMNNFIQLNVKDSGKGLPPEMIIDQNDSLGLQLVQTLVEQLEGTMEYSSDLGTNFLITFEMQNL